MSNKPLYGELKGDILSLGKVWQNLYACGIGLSKLFSYLMYVHFWKIHAGQYIIDFVNKTSHDKGGACATEKRKRCNRISSDITLGRNYPSAGYWLVFDKTQIKNLSIFQ